MPRSPFFCLLSLLIFGMIACGCGAYAAKHPPTSPPSSKTLASPGTESSHRESDMSYDDVELMRMAYALARKSATPDAPLTVQADALAAEAETQAILGAKDEAISLWAEALSLLESSAPDTTLHPPEPPPQPTR